MFHCLTFVLLTFHIRVGAEFIYQGSVSLLNICYSTCLQLYTYFAVHIRSCGGGGGGALAFQYSCNPYNYKSAVPCLDIEFSGGESR